MKKVLHLILAVVFVFSSVMLPCNASETQSNQPTYMEAPVISRKESMDVPGTTPADYAISFFALDRSAVDISNQIYKNLLKMNPLIFLLNNQGICDTNPWDMMTKDEFLWVRNKTKEVIDGKKTADEKIRTIAEYVAKNVGYDYDYYLHSNGTKEEYQTLLMHNAYDVLNNGRAVCYGYAATVCSMLQAEGIPCVMIQSPNHSWSMAYNGNRWILFDSTWMSTGRYEYGVLTKSDVVLWDYFDFSIEWANSNYNHLIEKADYTEYNNGIYTFPKYSAKLEWFVIPDNITTIGEYTFHAVDNIEITCDAKLKDIGYAAFYNCTNLKGSLDLSQAEKIEYGAFYNCKNLSQIICGNKLKVIGEWAFAKCENMKGVISFPNAEIINSYAFLECKNITGIILGNKLETLSSNAFYNCPNCTDIIWPKSLVYVSENAFGYMPALKNIYYYGSENDWDNIEFEYGTYYIDRANIVYDYTPSISVSKDSEDSFTFEYHGIPNGEKLIVCEYCDKKLVSVNIYPLEKTLEITSDNSESKTLKFMVFENIKTLCPKVKFVEMEKDYIHT